MKHKTLNTVMAAIVKNRPVWDYMIFGPQSSDDALALSIHLSIGKKKCVKREYWEIPLIAGTPVLIHFGEPK